MDAEGRAETNDYRFKVVKLEGDLVWRDHPETDETFLVIEGRLRIELEEGHVDAREGELFVVPRGVRHEPFPEREVKVVRIEPRGVLDTGHEGGERSAASGVWT